LGKKMRLRIFARDSKTLSISHGAQRVRYEGCTESVRFEKCTHAPCPQAKLSEAQFCVGSE
jgi:hypothetical protein